MECEKCKVEMISAFMMCNDDFVGLYTNVKKLFQNASDIKVFVCPKCGHIELYADDVSALTNSKKP